jgi:hypothetical protein
MHKSIKFFVAAAVLPFVTTQIQAQTASHVLTYQVSAINQVSVSGTPTLTINAAVAGSAPTTVTATGSTYSVTTNQSTAKITAAIDAAMPTGVTLSTTLAAPSGATSAGIKSLSASAVDVVTGITKLNASGLAITYQLDATSAAGVVASATRTVTYTITGGV